MEGEVFKEQNRKFVLLFFIGDTLTIILSFIVTYYLRNSIRKVIFTELPELYPFHYYYIRLLPLIVPIFWGCFFSLGLYKSMRFKSSWKELFDAVKGCTLGIFSFLFFTFFLKMEFLSRTFLLLFWFISIIFVTLSRLALKFSIWLSYKKGYNHRNILIVGSGEMAKNVATNLRNHPEFGFKVVGFIKDGSLEETKVPPQKIIGTVKDLPNILHNNVIDEVVYAVPLNICEKMAGSIRLCELEGIKVRIVADFFERTLARARADDIDGIPLVSLESGPSQELALLIKRMIDIIVSALLIILLSPFFLLIAVLIKLDSNGPVFFTQERVGRNGRRFKCLKFRSMVVNAEELLSEVKDLNEVAGPVFKIKDDPRITGIGRFLRKTSIDELPQLINVLKGEMSLVGPRPPIPFEVEKYDDWQRRRLSMRPGLTCIWQVSGRSNIPFERWMEMDLNYIDNWSLWLDLKLLLKTIPAVLKGTGSH
ncbi:MAG: sugar transferase [bacterium]|nr:sugar transferase [bacterium]